MYEHFTVSWDMENPLLEESVTVPDPVEKPKNTVAEAQTDEGKNEPGAQTVQETPTVPQLPHPLTVIVNHTPIPCREKLPMYLWMCLIILILIWAPLRPQEDPL